MLPKQHGARKQTPRPKADQGLESWAYGGDRTSMSGPKFPLMAVMAVAFRLISSLAASEFGLQIG